MVEEILFVAGGYLIGSIPTGLLLSKAFGGVDIRNSGSGNIGATNVYRTMGRKAGIITLLGDCLKGLVPVLLAICLGVPGIIVAATGLAAFLGHVYTVFLGFKGGKGVATALGVFLAVSPLAVLTAVAVFGIILYKSRFVSLSSITAAALMPILVALFGGKDVVVAMSLVISAIVIFKHRENIKRLRAGTENRFKA